MVELTLPGPADVLAAAARIAAHATVTPVLRSRALDALSGAHLHFKAEHLQLGGAAPLALPLDAYEERLRMAREAVRSDSKRVAQVVKGWVAND